MDSQQEPAVAVGQNNIDLAFIHAEAPRRYQIARVSSVALAQTPRTCGRTLLRSIMWGKSAVTDRKCPTIISMLRARVTCRVKRSFINKTVIIN